MSDRQMTVREAVAEYFADGEGDFNRGKENGFTVEDIVNKLEIPNNADNRKIVQVQILHECNVYRHDYNELAGGLFRNPTIYLIAGTVEEETAMIARHMNFTKSYVGGLETRLEASNSPILIAMMQAINGMVKSLNALTVVIDTEEIKDDNVEQLSLIV